MDLNLNSNSQYWICHGNIWLMHWYILISRYFDWFYSYPIWKLLGRFKLFVHPYPTQVILTLSNSFQLSLVFSYYGWHWGVQNKGDDIEINATCRFFPSELDQITHYKYISNKIFRNVILKIYNLSIFMEFYETFFPKEWKFHGISPNYI